MLPDKIKMHQELFGLIMAEFDTGATESTMQEIVNVAGKIYLQEQAERAEYNHTHQLPIGSCLNKGCCNNDSSMSGCAIHCRHVVGLCNSFQGGKK